MEERSFIYSREPLDQKSNNELLDTSEEIAKFKKLLSGLIEIKVFNKDNVMRVETRRNGKPIFTDEYTAHVMNMLYVKINKITGRSTIDRDSVDDYMFYDMRNLGKEIIREFKHYISSESWEKIIELNQIVIKKELLDDQSYVPLTDLIVNGVKIRNNYWWSSYRIVWNEDKPVTLQMLRIIKNEFKIIDDSKGRVETLINVINSMCEFSHLGLNRSENALAINVERSTTKQIMTSRQDLNESENGIPMNLDRFTNLQQEKKQGGQW